MKTKTSEQMAVQPSDDPSKMQDVQVGENITESNPEAPEEPVEDQVAELCWIFV
jgi:hypothetical protein